MWCNFGSKQDRELRFSLLERGAEDASDRIAGFSNAFSEAFQINFLKRVAEKWFLSKRKKQKNDFCFHRNC